MKTTAILLIAVVSVLAGQYANIRMKKRISSLRDLIVLIEHIDSHISYSKNTIFEIIRDFTLSADVKLKIMSELIKSENMNFSDNWNVSIIKHYRYDCLNKEDEKILLSFGKALGVTDIRGQCSNCRLHKTMLEKQLDCAEEKLKEKSKVNTALSFFLALSVVIIFY